MLKTARLFINRNSSAIITDKLRFNEKQIIATIERGGGGSVQRLIVHVENVVKCETLKYYSYSFRTSADISKSFGMRPCLKIFIPNFLCRRLQ